MQRYKISCPPGHNKDSSIHICTHHGRRFHSDQLQTHTRSQGRCDGEAVRHAVRSTAFIQCAVPSIEWISRVGKHQNALTVLLTMGRLCSAETRFKNRISISDVTSFKVCSRTKTQKNSLEGRFILRYSEGKHAKTIALWRVNTKTTCIHPLPHANEVPLRK